ncbi:MAG: LLM class F420-dependent oxidoreductase [Chloroflexi bacterium]|nr:LLM class F420-dependent oxidoreductase [Chloroflexota bacterium]
MPFRVGVQLHPQHTTYREYKDAVIRMEGLGVDTIWDWDHFFPLYGPPDGPHFEGWTLLAAMAELTTRATIGCLVTCNSYRNPALLSNMAKTVDHIAEGRFILGIGAGWFEREYREYGYEFGTAADRLRALEAALPIIKERWAKDNPPPVRGTIPILIGGGGERVTLRLTAQYADLWNGFGPVETFARKNRVLDDWCDRVGRPRTAVERTVSIGVEELDHLDAYANVGATHIILGFGPPYDGQPVERLVAWRDRRNRG